jgi:hypothetical protein
LRIVPLAKAPHDDRDDDIHTSSSYERTANPGPEILAGHTQQTATP